MVLVDYNLQPIQQIQPSDKITKAEIKQAEAEAAAAINKFKAGNGPIKKWLAEKISIINSLQFSRFDNKR